MNKVSMFMIALSITCFTGCATRLINSDVTTTTTTTPKNGVPITVTEKNNVTFVSGTVLVNEEVDKAKVKWGEVEISVGGFSTKGDVDTMKAIANGIAYGLMAYSSSGAVPAVSSIIQAMQSTTSTNAPAVTK